MAVFGDWAEKYFDLGINVIPIAEDKKPPKGFTFKKWLTEKQTEDDMAALLKQYGHSPGIAVICGPVSGVCGFDFDYKFDEKKITKMTRSKFDMDRAYIEAEIKSYLPTWTLAKVGKVGWTVFFKCHSHYSTLAPNRNGVRLFDFKASGYIVIPPSFHSFNDGQNLYYKWIEGDPMTEFQALPELDFSLIKDFALRFGEKSGAKAILDTRHGRIFMHGIGLSRLESDPVKIAESMIKYDQKVNAKEAKGLYFLSPEHCGSDYRDFAIKWAKRIIEYSKDSKAEKVAADSNVFDYFFLNKMPYGEPKKDILTRKIFYRHPSENRWATGSELLPSIKSYGKASGLPINSIEMEFERFQIECDKVDFLCDIPKHDGVDHLKTHVAALKSSRFNSDELYEIFLNWGYLLFARIHNSDVQNRCIIIKGNQGIGKDAWIKTMVSQFKPYYQMVDINRDTSEMTAAAQRVFVAHIAEFDQTKKLDVAFIKALITNPTSFFREKYGREALERPMKASWISSVNIDNMLRDDTGNRRFIVLPIESIDWSYPKVGPKILAQFKDAFERGLGQSVSPEVEAKVSSIVTGYTPDNFDDDIADLFLERLNMRLSLSTDPLERAKARVLTTDMAPIVADIAKIFQVSVKRVYAVVKKHRVIVKGTRYYVNRTKIDADLDNA
jgi:hypothetical protein